MPENITEEQALALGQVKRARDECRQAEASWVRAQERIDRRLAELLAAFAGDRAAYDAALDTLNPLPAAA